MELARPSFKRGLNISLNKGFDFDLMKPCIGKFNLKLDLPDGVEVTMVEGFDFGKEDYFSKFNEKNASDKIFLRIKKELDKPIVIDYSKIEGAFFVSSLYVLAERNSKSKIVLKWNFKEEGYAGAVVKILAEEGSEINVVSVLDFEKTHVVQRKSAKCLSGAKINWLDLILGGAVVLTDIQNFLEGESAKGNVTGLFVSKNSEVFDLNTEVFHNSSFSESEILTRGVCLDSSQSISRGLIKISENSRGCDGYEKHDVLLLGDEAEADAIPQLEILNDDVRCSHGTSIGKMDEEQIFYLMSRGLTQKEAEREIVMGYFSFVEQAISDSDLRREIYKKISASVV